MSHYPHDAVVVQPGQDLAAVVAALPNGSKVYLGDGTHTLLSTLTISGKTDISIEGSPAAIISYALGGTLSIDIVNSSRITLRGFGLTTNATNEGIRMGGVSDVRCLDLTVISNAAGSTVFGAFSLTNGNCSDVLIQGCHVSGAFQNTVRLSAGGGVTVTRIKAIDCHLNSGAGAGISNFDIVGAGGVTTDILISGCTILSGDRNVYVTGASYVVISGCILKSARSDGVFLDASAGHVDVIATIIDDPLGEGFQTAPTATGDTTVGGCIIYSANASGVYVESPRCIVDGTIIDDPAQYAFSFRDTSNHVANACVIYSPGFDGFDVRAGTQRTVNACVVIEPAFNGYATTGAVVSSVITNCIFIDNNSERMIELNTGVTDMLVCGNIVYLAAEKSIYVNASTRVSVQGNISDTPVNFHISFEGGCTLCLAIGNICWQNTSGNSNINISQSSLIQIRASIVNRNFNNSQLIVRVNGVNAFDILIESVIGITNNQGRFCNPDGSSPGKITVAGCICLGSGAGISCFTANASTTVDFRVNECIAIDSQAYGISSPAARAQFVGNLVDHTGAPGNYGLRLNSATPIEGVIAFNLVRRMVGGIKVEGDIVSWNLKGNSIFASTADGILINNGDEGNVTGNRIVGSVSDGIQEDAASDQNMYTENHVRGNGTATNFNGTNRTAADNKV